MRNILGKPKDGWHLVWVFQYSGKSGQMTFEAALLLAVVETIFKRQRPSVKSRLSIQDSLFSLKDTSRSDFVQATLTLNHSSGNTDIPELNISSIFSCGEYFSHVNTWKVSKLVENNQRGKVMALKRRLEQFLSKPEQKVIHYRHLLRKTTSSFCRQ